MFHPALHFVFEALAYAVGMLLWRRTRTRVPGAAPDDTRAPWLLVGAICGAALGSKLVFWLHRPDLWPHTAADLPQLMRGKTVVGGFLGGVVGVELAKKRLGLTAATGDVFVVPVMVGLIIGRFGCFFAGLPDDTYGLPTHLPWAVDFGDGIPRHPTQLYEAAAMALMLVVLVRLRDRLPRAGDGFKLFLGGYLIYRVLVGFIKPQPWLYGGVLSGIQLAALMGLVYYGPHLVRIGGAFWRHA